MKTAIQEIIDELIKLGIYTSTLKNIIEPKLIKEEEQIIDAAEEGYYEESGTVINGQGYYNRTYKN